MDQVRDFAAPPRAPEPQALLHALFDGAPEAIVLLDDDETIVGWNAAAAAVFGWSADEAVGRAFGELVLAPEDRASWRGRTHGRRARCSVRRRDGGGFPAELAVTDAQDGARRFEVVQVRDVSAVRDLERERDLARSQFQSFVENAPIAMTACTPEGRFTLFNRKSGEYYGRSTQEMFDLDLPTMASYWPNFDGDVYEVAQQVLRTGEPETVEAQIFSDLHGEPRMLRHSMFPVFEDADGVRRIALVGAMAVDVTDIVRARQEAEQAAAELRAQRALFRAFVDNAPLPMAAKRHDGRFIFANRQLAAAHARPVEEMPDVDVGERRRKVPGFEELIFRPGQLSIETGETIRTEGDFFSNAFNEVRSAQFTFFPIHEEVDGEDRITQGGMIVYDVTDMRRAEQAHRKVSARLTQFLDHAPMAVALADRHGELLVVNQTAAAYLGAPAEALVGRSLDELGRLWPPGEDSAASVVQRVRAGKTVRFARQASGEDDGEAGRIMDLTFFPIRDAAGEISEIGAFAIDVTQIRRAQDRLAAQQTAMHQTEKLAALGQLLAGVAHELNNPLAIVKGRAAILKEKLAGSPHEAAVDKLGAAAERCARIVKTFLAMARQAGPQRGPVDVNETVQGALDMTASGLRHAQVAVETALASGLPRIETDGDQLVQALINLIINAQHALEAHAGPRRLRIATRLHRDAGRVVIEVADSGPGIPAELVTRVFEPFYTSKEVGKGTGLGLSVCKAMVEGNGGELLLSETVGGGATFRILLPLVAAAESVAGPEPDAPARPPRPLRALVVDDEPDLAEILAESLGALGFACVVAGNGREALAAIAAGAFDAIFCDVRMPVMDGMAFYRALEREAPDHLSRLAFVSGDLLHRDVTTLTAEAGRPVIEKPFDPDQIRAAALALTAGARP